MQNKKPYQSYLLRLWQVEKNGEHVWRSSLESAQTGEQQLFASFEDLVVFLHQEFSEQPNPGLPQENHELDE